MNIYSKVLNILLGFFTYSNFAHCESCDFKPGIAYYPTTYALDQLTKANHPSIQDHKYISLDDFYDLHIWNDPSSLLFRAYLLVPDLNPSLSSQETFETLKIATESLLKIDELSLKGKSHFNLDRFMLFTKKRGGDYPLYGDMFLFTNTENNKSFTAIKRYNGFNVTPPVKSDNFDTYSLMNLNDNNSIGTFDSIFQSSITKICSDSSITNATAYLLQFKSNTSDPPLREGVYILVTMIPYVLPK